MKHFRHFTIFAFISLFAMSCSEDSNKLSELEVSPTELSFTSEGGIASFEVIYDGNWTVSSDYSAMGLSPTKGYGRQKISVIMPASASINQQHYTIVVKPDGGTPANVTVTQAGQFISGDVTMQITNYEGMISFGGKSGDTDSLRVLSNTPWQLYGPDWLEAWNGSRWVTLSLERAMLQGDKTTNQDAEGTTIVRLRTKSSNEDEDNRMADLVLKPAYTGTDAQVTLAAVQLGLHFAVPNFIVSLADGVACDFECGSAVTSVGAYLSDHILAESENPDWLILEPNYVYYEDCLNENTPYYMYSFGADKNNRSLYTCAVEISTGSSKNQALAEIVNPQFDSNTFVQTWDVKMNSYCKGYRQWATTHDFYFDYPDIMLAWYFGIMSYDEEHLNEYPIYTEDLSFTWDIGGNYHVQIITWGAGQDGNKMASLISRYNSENDEEESESAPARRLVSRNANPTPKGYGNGRGAMPIDFKRIRKAFKRIK